MLSVWKTAPELLNFFLVKSSNRRRVQKIPIAGKVNSQGQPPVQPSGSQLGSHCFHPALASLSLPLVKQVGDQVDAQDHLAIGTCLLLVEFHTVHIGSSVWSTALSPSYLAFPEQAFQFRSTWILKYSHWFFSLQN